MTQLSIEKTLMKLKNSRILRINPSLCKKSRNHWRKSRVQPAAMAQKRLRVASLNGDHKMVSVVDTTTCREILQQFNDCDVRDRQANLIRGVMMLDLDMTVSEAGLEDGDEISLILSDPFVEMASWTGEDMNQALYVRIPPEITSIDDEAFRDCSPLMEVVIHDAVVSIGEVAFDGCSSLTRVEIPDSVTLIGEGAFMDCSSLTQVEIPDSVTSIGAGAFHSCASLKQVKIPPSVTSIGTGAFAGCSSLTQVEIPNSVTRIGTGAFAGCSSMDPSLTA